MVSPVIVLKGGTPNLSVQKRRLNPFAICSFVSSLLPLLLFGALFLVGALQNVGYVDIDTVPFERWMKPIMLIFSAAAIILSYRAESQIVMGNGFYSGATLTSAGRNIGFVVGGLVILTILLWGL
jgi:hypothetical protein